MTFAFNFIRSNGGSRRESITAAGPPSTDIRGSVHNLQLDIMDDIVQARKARMKLWNTSNEKVCEVQTVDEAGTSSTAQRYTNRRFSDFITTTLGPIPQSMRRASENPSCMLISPSVSPAPTPSKKAGIICTNTDLISLLSSLASSATEINRISEVPTPVAPTPSSTQKQQPQKSSNFLLPERRTSLKKSNRSNSFDVSILKGVKPMTDDAKTSPSGNGWFTKRHMPASKRTNTVKSSAQATVSFAKETFEKLTDPKDSSSTPTASTSSKEKPNPKKRKEHKSPLNRLKWDGRSAIVDARIIGSAIEGFLRGGSSSKESSSKGSSKESARLKKTSTKTSWFSKTEEEDSSGDTCDTSSLCATLKDLFVK
jgi:hypothetical protein